MFEKTQSLKNIVFDRFAEVHFGSNRREFNFGRFATGRLLAWSNLGPTGWQWLEEATALPRVGLLDGPECGGKAEQPRWHKAADKHHPHCQSWPSPTLFLASRKKVGPCGTHFWCSWSCSKKRCFCNMSWNWFVSLYPTKITNECESDGSSSFGFSYHMPPSLRALPHDGMRWDETTISGDDPQSESKSHVNQNHDTNLTRQQ